jgi:hypothetical protein
VSSYVPLDDSFVTAWNDGSDPRVSALTYLALQDRLSVLPPFLSRQSRATTPSTASSSPLLSFAVPIRAKASAQPGPTMGNSTSGSEAATSNTDGADPDPTPIQKADLLITQQWLRLIVWQSSFKQGLLSWSAPHESMHFAFPLAIARRTASILAALPPRAVEVHGMGIFEKIFEIGTWCINVLGACDGAAVAGAGLGMQSGASTMDFATGNDLGVLGLSRRTPTTDPLEFFVRTLSASPMSRERFADRLLLFAGERPAGMRMALSPAVSPVMPLALTSAGLDPAALTRRQGSIIGEVADEQELSDVDMLGPMTDAVLGSDLVTTANGVADSLFTPTIGNDGLGLDDISAAAAMPGFGNMESVDLSDTFSFGSGSGPLGLLNTPRSVDDPLQAAALRPHLGTSGSELECFEDEQAVTASVIAHDAATVNLGDDVSGPWEM